MMQNIYGFMEKELRVDCKSLFDHLRIPGQVAIEQKRLVTDILALKEMLKEKDIDPLTWVPTHIMLADILTKKPESKNKYFQYIKTVLKDGVLPKDPPEKVSPTRTTSLPDFSA